MGVNGGPPRTLFSVLKLGAVGGSVEPPPKQQRANKKNTQQRKSSASSNQEINHIPKEPSVMHGGNYSQGPHNTTTYMNLPNMFHNKTCERCGVTGHIKNSVEWKCLSILQEPIAFYFGLQDICKFLEDETCYVKQKKHT